MEKRKVLIIVGFVIAICLIGLSIFMIIKTSNEVKQDKNGEVVNKDANGKKKVLDTKLEEESKEENNNVASTNVSNDYNSNIILEDNKSNDFTFKTVDTGEKTLVHHKTNIYYKDNLIKEIDYPVSAMYQIDDVALYILVGSGTDIGVYAIDKNGNMLKEFIEWDNELGISGIGAWKKEPKVDGNTITFNVTTYGISCDAIDKEQIVMATYQTKYLGNNQFSELELISSKTRKEACANQQ